MTCPRCGGALSPTTAWECPSCGIDLSDLATPDASGTHWYDTDWRIQRSMVNDAVWVPITVDSDNSCFLHAGTLRQAKAYLAREWHGGPTGEPVRWRKVDADTYALEAQHASDDDARRRSASD